MEGNAQETYYKMIPGSTINVLRSQRVLCGNDICPAVILIKDGKIKSILPETALTLDAGETQKVFSML